MSGICSKCEGCTRYFGRVEMNPIFGTTMIYDCAESCYYYQHEQDELEKAKAEAEAKAKAEEEAKRVAEQEALCKYFHEKAVEPSWAKNEFPRQYAEGYKLFEIEEEHLFGWVKDNCTLLGKGFIPSLKQFAF